MDASVLPDSLDVPPEHALLVVDMRNYSQLPEAKMAPIRADLDDIILNTVFPHSGLDDPRSREGAYRDTGDGAICVVPARDTARLVDPLLGHLNAALSRYDQSRLRGGSAIWVRVSVHVGPLSLPDRRGDAINEACRLVDSQAVRQAMTAATKHGAYVAAVLSGPVFDRTVHAGRTPHLQQTHFLTAVARVEGKSFEQPCRLHVPGLAAETLQGYVTERPPAADVVPADPPPAPAGSGTTMQFLGSMKDTNVIGSVGTYYHNSPGR
ncbi:hypothetical protein [Streptomyces sp. NRRL S-813]|uniref:hypothetical protein n=1 Tax=Streptomyces sp. NRRL S-813 TaxID=1463919 RepID=UPI0004BF9628|nr:hypothetical protein [Streptomyces sp. NRRL S-813]